jgi:hypothetical protein
MAIRTRAAAALAVIAGACLAGPSRDASAGIEEPLRLMLNVYTYAAVNDDIRSRAATTVAEIYAAAGVETVWIDRCFRPECRREVTLGDRVTARGAQVTALIVPDDMTPPIAPPAVMGMTPSDSYVTYAFSGRIHAFAFAKDLPLSVVLGHVIAHEIGHILLRTGHTDTGIMRAEWFDRDLVDLRRVRLRFTPAQGAVIRSRVAKMGSDPRLPRVFD